MFQDPFTAVMTMLFLYFVGILVMFVFVIRSLGVQGEERRESFRKQQLMLGDLERHLIDMKVMLRRLMPEKGDADDEQAMRDSPLPILKQEDPLEAMLEAAATARKQEAPAPASKPLPPRSELSASGQGAAPGKSSPLPGNLASPARPVRGRDREDQGLPDFFSDPDKHLPGRKAHDASMFPPHESLRNSSAYAVPDKAPAAHAKEAAASRTAFPQTGRKPVNFVSLKGAAEDGHGLLVEKVEGPVQGGPGMTVPEMMDSEEQSLQVFRLEKTSPPHGQEEPAEFAPPLAASRAAGVTDEDPPAWLKELDSQESSAAGIRDNREEQSPSLKKPRLRVPGPPTDFDMDLPAFAASASQADSAGNRKAPFSPAEEKVVAGMGGALFTAQNARPSNGGTAGGPGPDEDGESLRRIYEEGLKAEETVNLFDIEAEREERNRDEAGQAEAEIPDLVAELKDDGYPDKAGEPVPRGFTVVPGPPLGADRSVAEYGGPFTEPAGPVPAGAGTEESPPEESRPAPRAEARGFSGRIGKYSLEVKPLLAPASDGQEGKSVDPAVLPDLFAEEAAEQDQAVPGAESGQEEALSGRGALGGGTSEPAGGQEEQAAQDAGEEHGEEDTGRPQPARPLTDRDPQAFNFRKPHPIDKTVMSGRKQPPGKKGRHPTFF